MFSFIFAWFAGGGGGDANPILVNLPFFAIIFLIFYFLIIRPQMKRQREHRSMLESLKKGDNVVAAGGICGTIAGMKDNDNIIILKVDDKLKIEVLKSSVSNVIRKE